jgi:hypothetical protein
MWISKLAFLTLAFTHLGLAAPADELNKNFARDDNGLQKVVRYRLPIPNPQSPIPNFQASSEFPLLLPALNCQYLYKRRLVANDIDLGNMG